MWEKKQTSFRVMPHFLKISGLVLLTAFFLNIFWTTISYANSFSWQNDKLIYNNLTFIKSDSSLQNKTLYVHRQGNKALTLQFSQQPTQAKSAEYIEYQIETGSGKFIKPSSAKTVQLTTTQGQQSNDKPTSSCNIPGVGWLFCPAINFMASSMDGMVEIINNFLQTRSISTDADSPLMTAWRIARNIANTLFIAVFMVIILSYLTNYGVSNYAIKKTLPKLIIGAILVNVSFYVCLLALDLSNIIGHNIAGGFRSIQSQISGPNFIAVSWTDLAKSILGGGALIVGAVSIPMIFSGIAGIALALGSALLGLAITLIMTIVILAARQAIIISLIIAAPLAFVANLLPNTETFFKKWLDLFKKMLFIFPMFSLLYGSAQLAGAIIISSATDIITLMLGMVVQIVPLVALPKMIRESDSILSDLGKHFGNGVLNPVQNTASNWLNKNKEVNRQRYLAGGNLGALSSFNLPRKVSQMLENNRRLTAEKLDAYSMLTDANYIKLKAKAGEKSILGRQYYKIKIQNAEALSELEISKLELNTSIKNTIAEEFKRAAERGSLEGLEQGMRKNKVRSLALNTLYSKVEESRSKMADGMRDSNFNKLISNRTFSSTYGTDLITASTGIYNGESSTDAIVLAKAISASRKEHNEAVAATDEALKNYNINFDQLQKLAFDTVDPNIGLTGTDNNGIDFTFHAGNKLVQEAAIKAVMRTKVMGPTLKIIEESGDGGSLKEFASVISEAIWANQLQSGAVFLGNITPDAIAQGQINADVLDMLKFNNIVKGRFGNKTFAGQDKDVTTSYIKALQNLANNFNNPAMFDAYGNYLNPTQIAALNGLSRSKILSSLKKYHDGIYEALNDNLTASQINEAGQDELRKLAREINSFLQRR